jgi:hypothetical protein
MYLLTIVIRIDRFNGVVGLACGGHEALRQQRIKSGLIAGGQTFVLTFEGEVNPK